MLQEARLQPRIVIVPIAAVCEYFSAWIAETGVANSSTGSDERVIRLAADIVKVGDDTVIGCDLVVLLW